MAIVKKTSSVQGKWIDKKSIVNDDIIKFVSAPAEIPNPQGGTQLVGKARVKGKSKEDENLAINGPSKNALIDAFGEDTDAWVGKLLTAKIEKVVVGGKRGIALYLVPEGMVLKESDDGFLYIGHPDSPSGTIKDSTAAPEKEKYDEEQIDPEDINF